MRFCLLFLFPFLSHTCIVRWIHHCLEDQRLLQLQTIHLIQKWLSVGSCWVQKMSWAWRRKHTSVNRVGWKWLLKLEDDLEKKKKKKREWFRADGAQHSRSWSGGAVRKWCFPFAHFFRHVVVEWSIKGISCVVCLKEQHEPRLRSVRMLHWSKSKCRKKIGLSHIRHSSKTEESTD